MNCSIGLIVCRVNATSSAVCFFLRVCRDLLLMVILAVSFLSFFVDIEYEVCIICDSVDMFNGVTVLLFHSQGLVLVTRQVSSTERNFSSCTDDAVFNFHLVRQMRKKLTPCLRFLKCISMLGVGCCQVLVYCEVF